MRCGFLGGPDLLVRDVLNIGVAPDRLLTLLRTRFEAHGGVCPSLTLPVLAPPGSSVYYQFFWQIRCCTMTQRKSEVFNTFHFPPLE